jgi:hypothetical protein
MSDKNKKKQENKQEPSSKSFKTEEKLSKGNCESAFYNMLRGGENGHAETKMTFVPLKVKKLQEQTSHIFTGEDPSTIKESQKKHVKQQKSNVMFNDSYFEKNPKINPQKCARYNFEEKYKKNAKYSDELILSDRRKKLLERKINDNFKTNPIKILNKEENDKYNKEISLKNQRHTQAFKKMMGSEGCKRVLGGVKSNRLNPEQNQVNKITNNDFNITQKSVTLNKDENNQVPYYGRRHFRFASCGTGNGLVYFD